MFETKRNPRHAPNYNQKKIPGHAPGIFFVMSSSLAIFFFQEES